jgi:hypothetical protein
MGSGRIIFVHGMGEKPEREAERRRMWEPLARGLWAPIPYEAFQIAYWADLRKPPDGALALKPAPEQVRALPARQRAGLGWVFGGLDAYVTRPDMLVLNVIERIGRAAQGMVMRGAAEVERGLRGAVAEFMGDLGPYLDGATREPIVARVHEQLDAAEGRPVCVISHSMGVLVAFDAILSWDGKVDAFVTMGGPLGWEYLKSWLGRPAYPENVSRWSNLYDRLDNVAFPDRAISNDYRTADGGRLVNDVQVRDNYAPNGDRDPHHWFGYLTSPELAEIVSQFWLGTAAAPPSEVDGARHSNP